jgi:hypothetical protein
MQPPQRYRRVILVAILMVVATISLCLWWLITHTTHPLPVTLPAEDEIEMMTATIDDSTEAMGISPLPTFVISPEDYGIILSALTPTEEYEYPAGWENMTVGRVEILKKGGKRLTIKFCEAGKNKLCFSVDGIRCMRGGEYKPVIVGDDLTMYTDESMVFYNILRGIHQKNVTGKESEELRSAVQWLQRSMGQQPPERR